MKTYKTYSNAFKWQTVIYSIQDVKLPFPLPIDLALYYVIAMLVVCVIAFLFRIVIVNALVHFGGLPIVMVMAMKNLNPEDKTSLKWLKDFFEHLLYDPKEVWAFDTPDKYDEECVFDNRITYRLED